MHWHFASEVKEVIDRKNIQNAGNRASEKREKEREQDVEKERGQKSIYLILKSVCSLIWLMRLLGLNCLIGLNHFVVCARIHEVFNVIEGKQANAVQRMNELANECRRSVFLRFPNGNLPCFLLHLSIYFNSKKRR